jgi:hypothetical protein
MGLLPISSPHRRRPVSPYVVRRYFYGAASRCVCVASAGALRDYFIHKGADTKTSHFAPFPSN